MHEATTDSDLDRVSLLEFNVDSPLAELVHTLRFPKEQNLHLFSFGVLGEEVGQLSIDHVLAVADVDSFALDKVSKLCMSSWILPLELLTCLVLSSNSLVASSKSALVVSSSV